jgi:hypothetical protein
MSPTNESFFLKQFIPLILALNSSLEDGERLEIVGISVIGVVLG